MEDARKIWIAWFKANKWRVIVGAPVAAAVLGRVLGWVSGWW